MLCQYKANKMEWTLSYNDSEVFLNGKSFNDIYNKLKSHQNVVKHLLSGKTCIGYREGKTFLETGRWFVKGGNIYYEGLDRTKKNKDGDLL